MTISVAITWILFLGLFPIAFFWLRRAWQILFKQDFSQVALKRGEPPADAAKYAPYVAAINLVAGAIAVAVILMVVIGGVAYDTWTAIAGSTIWMKFFADYIVSRNAHANWGKKKPADPGGRR
ncbi:MAG: hypothetical protein DVS81_05040 [Candidatus Accumulibacter meliphilus]|jgi:hypothetical protein|uniref:DUF3784 domain-containing protein n=1 Tax=Candidatus Accumulibacter meliphilus TaxID=2211374 RepID=A0A369XN32_9PROT|nr:MAG: hypothetical protein DVS81_05040 [Candidatus Accumulibacter meliphilus]